MFVVAREVTHDPSPCCFNILDLTKCQTWSRQRAYHKTQGTHCLCDAKRRCHSSAQLLLPCGCMHAEGQIQQQNTCSTLPVKQCSKSPHSCTHTHVLNQQQHAQASEHILFPVYWLRTSCVLVSNGTAASAWESHPFSRVCAA